MCEVIQPQGSIAGRRLVNQSSAIHSTGQYTVPQEAKVEGSTVTLKQSLQGYALAEYPAGTNEPPTYLPWVDEYIQHFRTQIEPKYPSLFLESS